MAKLPTSLTFLLSPCPHLHLTLPQPSSSRRHFQWKRLSARSLSSPQKQTISSSPQSWINPKHTPPKHRFSFSSTHFFSNPSSHSVHYQTKLKSSLIVCASSSSINPSSNPSSNPSKPSSPFVPALNAASSAAVIILLDKLAANLFQALAISFPSSLAAMLAMFAFLLSLNAKAPQSAQKVNDFFAPGVALIAKWLALFFVPILIALPLAPVPAPADLWKIAFIVIAGFVASLLFTVAAVNFVRSLFTNNNKSQSTSVTSVSASAPTAPAQQKVAPSTLPSKSTVLFWIISTALGFVASIATNASTVPYLIFTLSLTIASFALGQLFPPHVKKIFHPLITCTIVTLSGITGLASIFSSSATITFTSLLSRFFTRNPALPWLQKGAGDILVFLLGPAVLSFSFQMYNRRALMKKHAVEIFGATLLTSIFGLFGTAAVARLLAASLHVRLFVLPRQITAPLAIAISDIVVQATSSALDPKQAKTVTSLAASCVSVTGLLGANFAKSILDAFRVKDPVTRGLATGSSAHGLGTAAMVDEPQAFAFAAIAMAIVGVFSTILVCIPPVRNLLLWIALGSLKTSLRNT